MKENLILGGNGFVGSNLRYLLPCSDVADSKNVSSFYSQSFRKIFCCAPQAKKWWANLNPQEDLGQIRNLIRDCQRLSAQSEFVLFSTVDIFDPPLGANETSTEHLSSQPYGQNRYFLEQELRNIFAEKLRIVRLPGLVGKNLRKNIIYDLLRSNNLHLIPLNSNFQWFNLDFLLDALSYLESNNTVVLNIATEPVPTRLIVDRWFPHLRECLDSHSNGPNYDIHTLYAKNSRPYLYDRKQVMDLHLACFIEKSLSA